MTREEAKDSNGMLDSTGVLAAWEECMNTLKDKDFQNDSWRLAYNAFLEGFRIGCMQVMQEEQKSEEWSEDDERIKNIQKELSEKIF